MSGCIHTTYISYSTASYWTHSFPFPSLAGADDFSYYVIDSKVDRQDSPCGLYYYPCLRVLSPRKHLESRNLLPDQYPMISNQTLYFLFLSHSLECRCWSCFINWLFTRLELGLMLLCYKSSLQMLCYRIRENEIALLSQWTEEILYLGKKFYCLWKPKDIDDISSVQTTAHVSFLSWPMDLSTDRKSQDRSTCSTNWKSFPIPSEQSIQTRLYQNPLDSIIGMPLVSALWLLCAPVTPRAAKVCFRFVSSFSRVICDEGHKNRDD